MKLSAARVRRRAARVDASKDCARRSAQRSLTVKFGLFYQLPCTAEQSEPARYQETIDQIVLADQLGFDVAWLAELHFFKNFSIMPSPR
jgi:hypothetical protein